MMSWPCIIHLGKPLFRTTTFQRLNLLTIFRRYQYNEYLVNWRAVVAFVVGVAPNLPGFINNVNPAIDPGIGKRPFTFAWLLGFVATTVVYMTLSWIWKPHETFIDRAVLPDEVYDAEDSSGESSEVLDVEKKV